MEWDVLGDTWTTYAPPCRDFYDLTSDPEMAGEICRRQNKMMSISFHGRTCRCCCNSFFVFFFSFLFLFFFFLSFSFVFSPFFSLPVFLCVSFFFTLLPCSCFASEVVFIVSVSRAWHSFKIILQSCGESDATFHFSSRNLVWPILWDWTSVFFEGLCVVYSDTECHSSWRNLVWLTVIRSSYTATLN